MLLVIRNVTRYSNALTLPNKLKTKLPIHFNNIMRNPNPVPKKCKQNNPLNKTKLVNKRELLYGTHGVHQGLSYVPYVDECRESN